MPIEKLNCPQCGGEIPPNKMKLGKPYKCDYCETLLIWRKEGTKNYSVGTQDDWDCPACGVNNLLRDFCKNCGESLTKVCPRCKDRFNINHNYCRNGHNFADEQAATILRQKYQEQIQQAEETRQRVEYEKEAYKKQHLRRKKTEKVLRRKQKKRKTLIIWGFGLFFLITLVTVFVLSENLVTQKVVDIEVPKITNIPTQTIVHTEIAKGSKLISDDVINFIPALSEMPLGYYEDSSSGPLPYANADGYSQIYKNPDFVQFDREVFVGYFAFVCEDSISATSILTEFVEEITRDMKNGFYEELQIDNSKIAKVDQTRLYFFETKTPSGNYNVSYITGIQYSNFINIILIAAPVDDPSDERGIAIKDRLLELSYYYTSLVSLKLPIPPDEQVLMAEPEYQRFSPSPFVEKSHAVAKNYIASADSGGVSLEISRILIADKNAIGLNFSAPIFDDATVLIEFIFKIVNNTGEIINFYADQGTVAINDEQINFIDYMGTDAYIRDEIGGEFLPGVTAVGGIWVGMNRASFAEINKILISIDSPTDNNHNTIGSDYYFDIDVTDWTFEELPDEFE